jgi:ParB-like chromosome segregation protein Spo0J
MADGRTVVCGHQRLRAALHNKLEKVACIVRGDLTKSDDLAVLELLVGDNYYRRQQSKLQQTKAAFKLAEIECDREKVSDWGVERKRMIEKKVLSRLGGSLKSVQRYILVAKAPRPIQDAFERDILSLVNAVAVAGLEPSKQEKLGKAVAELLEQMEAEGDKAVRKIRETVHETLNKAKRPKKKEKGKPGPSAMDPIIGIKSGLQEHLSALEANREQIVTCINASSKIPRFLRMQALANVRSGLERGLELLTEIETAVEAEPVAEEDADDEWKDLEYETSCPVNDEIVDVGV